ncbi:hypothetical protein K490DRAFT_67869 [Saccharata proteae CBS 121410]|uniref:Uncharacterized protein n=1 Tax=Saccharata proteae CBS 121410 TaxID=1314787 RepID=A0A9P4HR94_9PEZI|nr:hypothetical protein K490DRAFT_67869 [Saccharata proteae CBS 121410]
MEGSPLTLAHAHARNASAETWKANSSQASDEHLKAAGEFANAAKGTADAEALRILKLLESHHHRIARIIKSDSSQPATSAPKEQDPSAQITEAGSTRPSNAATRALSPRRAPPSPPRSAPRRKPARDSPSSIASNLATARGIPGSQRKRATPASPAVSAQNADGKILNRADRQDEPLPQDGRKDSSRDIKTIAEDEEYTETEKERAVQPPRADEPFKRFFSTFETFYSALSAPLAFTGLPLGLEESNPEPPKKTSAKSVPKPSPSTSTRGDHLPDPSALFSRATLRSLGGGNGKSLSAAESFYVIPPSGGTKSYASILSHSGDRNQPGIPSPIIEQDASLEEFVDASEEPAPPSPTTTRGSRRRAGSSGSTRLTIKDVPPPGKRKTMEELELENAMMRKLVDNMTRRLHMWETTAQSQSLAMAQSYQFSKPLSKPAAAETTAVDTTPQQRLQELEMVVDQLQRDKAFSDGEMERLERENERITAVLGKYRQRWEQLKAGAKDRRERSNREGSSAAPGGAAEGSPAPSSERESGITAVEEGEAA